MSTYILKKIMESAESYDIVMSGLCFSELTTDELNYRLKQSTRLLKSGAFLLVSLPIATKLMPGTLQPVDISPIKPGSIRKYKLNLRGQRLGKNKAGVLD